MFKINRQNSNSGKLQLERRKLKMQNRRSPLTTSAAAAALASSSSSSSSSSSPNQLKSLLIFRYPAVSWTLNVFFIITIAVNSVITSAKAADSLLGNLQSCSNEGEEVPIQAITNSKCFKCVCQNGFVNCDKESCPAIDDCYLLDPKGSDTCCRKCKGCQYKGITYASGSEWTDPDNPCSTYKCIASVVTETTMKCYTQCDDNQIIPPRKGECCPTCYGCKINGQIVAEGQEVVASIDDRCLVCKCSGRKLTCAKKTCPILQCPISKQIQHPDECCPRCTEKREFMQVSGKCIFNQKVYADNTNFTPDRCSNCTCSNGTTLCQRNTCPILECAPEYQEMTGCCPRCMISEYRSECLYNGTTYQNNETWNLGPCRSCRCTAGTIRCAEMKCPPVKCKANEAMIVAPGECCPKCVETAGTCTVFGDPHFKTFDGKFFSFQGSCKYQLAADCRDHSFSIRLTNDGRQTRRSSWPKTVTLKMKGIRVNLGQKLRIKVNGSRVSLPYSHGSVVSIERLTDGVQLKTDIGIQVEWDGNNFLQLQVPSTYKGKLCGLCGNYNGIGRDDLTSRDGSTYSEEEVWRFANSWKVGGPKACSRKTENIVIQPMCKQRRSNAFCKPLKESKVFGDCDSRLNPLNYFESCKMDVCECPMAGMCHCDSFAAYAHECKRLGVRLPDWRATTNCSLGLWRRSQQHNFALAGNISVSGGGGGGYTNSKSSGGSSNDGGGGGGSFGFGINRRFYDGDNTLLDNSLRPMYAQTSSSSLRRNKQTKRKKQLQQQQQQHQQQQQQQQLHNNLLQRTQQDFMSKHIPKALLIQKSPDRTPPPLH